MLEHVIRTETNGRQPGSSCSSARKSLTWLDDKLARPPTIIVPTVGPWQLGLSSQADDYRLGLQWS